MRPHIDHARRVIGLMRDRPNTMKRLGWGLAARLAQREMRGDGGRGTKWGFLPGFRIFLLCLILGIFTISGVGSLSAALVAGMVAQGQSILGGDIDVRLIHRPASAEERDFLSGNGRLSEIATMRAMLRHQDEAMLVEATSTPPIRFTAKLRLRVRLRRRWQTLADGAAVSKACSTGGLPLGRWCNWVIFNCA